jgi:dephospho-CoA kinase
MAARRIGLTGGIASGKSVVADILLGLGAVIIDADELSRLAVAPGTPGLQAVVAAFGDRVLQPDGTLDRAELGRIVFDDPARRAELEAIVHPQVRRLAEEIIAGLPADATVVEVIPLLVETGQQDRFDAVVVVDSDPDVQLSRLMARSGLSRDQALARIAAQASRETRLGAADYVLDNNSDLVALEKATKQLWDAITTAP